MYNTKIFSECETMLFVDSKAFLALLKAENEKTKQEIFPFLTSMKHGLYDFLTHEKSL